MPTSRPTSTQLDWRNKLWLPSDHTCIVERNQPVGCAEAPLALNRPQNARHAPKTPSTPGAGSHWAMHVMGYAYLMMTATFAGAIGGAIVAHVLLVPVSLALGFGADERGAREAICTAGIVVGIVGLQIVLLLGSIRREPADTAPHCRVCGYNLTLNTTGACPECGTHYAPPAPVPNSAPPPTALPQFVGRNDLDCVTLARLTENLLAEPTVDAAGRPVVFPNPSRN